MITFAQSSDRVVRLEIVVQPDCRGGRIKIRQHESRLSVALRVERVGDRADIVVEQREFVADLRAVCIGCCRNRCNPPINRAIEGVVIHEASFNNFCRAATDAERAFGIRSVHGVIEEAAVHFELITRTKINIRRQTGDGIQRNTLRGWTAAENCRRVARTVDRPLRCVVCQCVIVAVGVHHQIARRGADAIMIRLGAVRHGVVPVRSHRRETLRAVTRLKQRLFVADKIIRCSSGLVVSTIKPIRRAERHVAVDVEAAVELGENIYGRSVGTEHQIEHRVRDDGNINRVRLVGEIHAAEEIAVRINTTAHLVGIRRRKTRIAVHAVLAIERHALCVHAVLPERDSVPAIVRAAGFGPLIAIHHVAATGDFQFYRATARWNGLPADVDRSIDRVRIVRCGLCGAENGSRISHEQLCAGAEFVRRITELIQYRAGRETHCESDVTAVVHGKTFVVSARTVLRHAVVKADVARVIVIHHKQHGGLIRIASAIAIIVALERHDVRVTPTRARATAGELIMQPSEVGHFVVAKFAKVRCIRDAREKVRRAGLIVAVGIDHGDALARKHIGEL